MNPWGYCLPIKNSNCVCAPVKIAPGLKMNTGTFTGQAAYLSFSDEENTVKLFVDALTRSRLEDARVYISKNYAKDFDLNELSDYFHTMCNYKNLIKAEFNEAPKNCKTNSILVLSCDNKRGDNIVHLHMIKEPDSFSKWKIYGIDKE